MEKIKVKLRNHSMMTLETDDWGIYQELHEYFSFYVPGYKFVPSYRNKLWDGKIKLFNLQTHELNVGLFEKFKQFCKERMYGIELVEHETYGLIGSEQSIDLPKLHKDIKDWCPKYDIRDYQFNAVVHALTKKRGVLLSPTGSGKSFIIYNLMRWYLENETDSILVIVPTTSLVEQMYSDFADYGMDVDNEVHKIYSGADKKTNKRVIVSTWQSIYKLRGDFFFKFGCVIGDEAHGFKAASLNSIMNKAINAEYRFGLTGTLDGKQVHKLQLTGLFGEVKRVTTTKALQEDDTLAQLQINVLKLNYKDETKALTKTFKYQQEIDFIVAHEKRNKFIANLTLDQKGNTLVLFNYVDKHGKPLFELIREKAHEKRKVFFVSGGTDTTDREAIRKIVEKQGSSVILSFGNIKIKLNHNDKVPLNNGKYKLASDITKEDDVSDEWIEINK